MNTEQILALQPGPDLDRMVHEQIFGGAGRRKNWSTTNAAMEIIEAVPVACGRRLATDPDFKADRPFWGGIVEHMDNEESGVGYATTARIFSATLPLALCKIGLMAAVANKPRKAEDKQ